MNWYNFSVEGKFSEPAIDKDDEWGGKYLLHVQKEFSFFSV
jgi:hypothetical protein